MTKNFIFDVQGALFCLCEGGFHIDSNESYTDQDGAGAENEEGGDIKLGGGSIESEELEGEEQSGGYADNQER